MDKQKRVAASELPIEKRVNCFDEVVVGFSPKQAAQEAERCLNCKKPLCKQGCPAGVDIPEFITQIKNGNPMQAAMIIKRRQTMPQVCGRVCFQEKQCEGSCIRKRIDQAVSIGMLERYAGDCLAASGFSEAAETGAHRVALVGCGPASIACADELLNCGIAAEIFEADSVGGGILSSGIPQYRLPKYIVAGRIDELVKKGAKIHFGTTVGRDIMLEKLMRDFDAVFVGIGADLPQRLGIEGEELGGVFYANDYLRKANAFAASGKRDGIEEETVVVIGGGNVAFDAARVARRMGAGRVIVAYRRGLGEMPARPDEIEHAKQEGVELVLMARPEMLVARDGRVSAVRCVETVYTEFDGTRYGVADGKKPPFDIVCGTVVIAAGTTPNPVFCIKGIELSKRGTIIVDDNCMTTLDRVYAAGDAVSGADTVVRAVFGGRLAAQKITQRLAQKG